MVKKAKRSTEERLTALEAEIKALKELLNKEPTSTEKGEETPFSDSLFKEWLTGEVSEE